jgi:hypothetical protein
MLLLRERALKEKTALELACLEQMKQRLRDKGADDRHPDIIRKEKSIRKNHQLRQVRTLVVGFCVLVQEKCFPYVQ